MKAKHSKVTMGILVTFAYIALSVFSLFMITGHASHGMAMSDCPYMAGQHAMCSMDTFSHITAWQNVVNTILSETLLLIIFVAILVPWPLVINTSPPSALRRRPERKISLYTELFSQGILNPKIP